MVPFIGTGSGRCGTTTLARILSRCAGVRATHESSAFRLCDWTGMNNEQFKKAAFDFHRVGGRAFGDVAFYWSRRTFDLKIDVPPLKVVVLWRSCDEVVRSFLDRWGGKSRFLPPSHADYLASGLPEWHSMFPVYDRPTAEESLKQHHRETYMRMHEFGCNWPDDIFWMHTQSLNDDAILRDLFAFLEIPEGDRAFPPANMNRVFNAGGLPAEGLSCQI
jgi:hypothetical protein